MTFISDLENTIDDYLSGKYEIIELDYVPTVDNIALGKKAYKVKLCSLFIDMRDSGKLMSGWKETSAKVHKAFLKTIAELAEHYGGKIRDFQGDGVLIFWSAKTKDEINKAVKAAMVIKWLLSVEFKKYFERYVDGGIDFGIGIDWSDAFVIRAGTSTKKENNDLVYISPSVNIAVQIANKLRSPSNIGITERVYGNLNDENKLTTQGSRQIDMWKNGWSDSIEFNRKTYSIYRTSYYWKLKK